MKEHWMLDPAITYLNHGSFGATPLAILAKQDEYRSQMEREPVRFFVRELESMLEQLFRARSRIRHRVEDMLRSEAALFPNWPR